MPKFDESKRCTIHHLSRAGLNQNQIAKRIGCSRQNVHQLYNYVSKREEQYARTRRLHDRVEALFENAWTMEEIAKEVKRSVGYVRVILNGRGWRKEYVKYVRDDNSG